LLLRANLLFKVVVGKKDDSILAVHNTLCVLKVLLDIFPAYNTLTCRGIMAGGDIDDVRRGRVGGGPESLRASIMHVVVEQGLAR